MKKYLISGKDNKVVIKIRLSEIVNDPPDIFADEIEALIEKYKGHAILIDATQLPEHGIPKNGDFTRTRLDYLVTLTTEVSQLRIRSGKAVYECWHKYLPNNIEGTSDGYRINAA